MSGQPKLSASMAEVLRRVGSGNDPYRGCRGRSEFGGRTRTLQALVARRLIELNGPFYILTAAGERAQSQGTDGGER